MAKTDEQAQQTAQSDAPRAQTTLGYEQARDELVEVVRRLEAGGTSLEESLALWERGEELAKVCRRWLEGARARLDAALADETDADEDGAAGAPKARSARRRDDRRRFTAHRLSLTPYYSPQTGRAELLPAVVRPHSIHRVRPGRAAHCVIQSTFRTLRRLFS
ncbi:hypothetical protein SANT12839_060480 [Streptomyces antimycoticus]|uniref:Exodeoxyribonuclease 7 small subunit n=1 Tax=Streptomyces antimycoticus TaxID=68175 RepID=A0A4D4KEF7_9ACTN|nr:hypothetical protein SANT12839_060480 [Streptomyces antimycoticus]